MTTAPSVIATIRRHARSGDTLRAWRLFESAGLTGSLNADVLSLRGRLLKNRGLNAAGDERRRLLDEAAGAYLAAAGTQRATYPLINAATIAFLNDKPDQARELARRTLELLDSGVHAPETPYWLAATRAEAALLLGDIAAGRTALEAAVTAAPEAWEDQAATLHQLEALLAETGGPTDMLEPLRPPPSLYYGGLIGLESDDRATIAAIETVLDDVGAGFVYGALAAGIDIVVAELAIARGGRLHAVLPMPVDAFRAVSVSRFGADWAGRFDRLIEQAIEIETLTDQDDYRPAAVALSEDIAMGLAIRRSRALAANAAALRVRRAADAPVSSDLAWQALGLPFHDIVVERSSAVIHDAADGAFEPRAPRAVLAITEPIVDADGLPDDALSATTGTATIIVTADLPGAIDYATRRIATRPGLQAGLDYRVIEGDRPPTEIAGLALQLARAAPAGGILAARPGALAIELRASAWRFEAAGEIATPIGDIPVLLHVGAA